MNLSITAFIFLCLAIGSQAQFVISSDNQSWNLQENYYRFVFNTTQAYQTFTFYSNLTELRPATLYYTTDRCSNRVPQSYDYCYTDAGNSISFSIREKYSGVYVLLSVIPLTGRSQGTLNAYRQDLVSVELGVLQVADFNLHNLRTFSINLDQGAGLFGITTSNPNLIKKYRIFEQNCNDQTKLDTDLALDFVVEVFNNCQVVFGVYSKQSLQGISFTPVMQEKVILQPLGTYQTLIPQNLTQEQGLQTKYFRIQISDIQTKLGFSAPFQVYFQIRGISLYESFSVFTSFTEILPSARSSQSADCYQKNICNLKQDIVSGNSFIFFVAIVPTTYIEGIEEALSILPTAFPSQGYQPLLFKADRYLEFDYTLNYPGQGAFYFEYLGQSTSDVAKVYECVNQKAFSISSSYWNENQYVFGHTISTVPTKFGYYLSTSSFSKSFQFNYQYVPILNFNQTTFNYVIQSPYLNSQIFVRFFSAQIPSFSNVASASVQLLLVGSSGADKFNVHLTTSGCNKSPLPYSYSSYCDSLLNVSKFDYKYTLQANQPLYFGITILTVANGHSLNLIFTVTCVSGFILANNQCVSSTPS